jgi:hypothetical protein
VGAIEAVVAAATRFNVVPDTAAETPEFVNVTCTDDAVPGRAAEGVPAPITRVNEVGLVCVHAAAVVPMAITTTTAVALAYVHVAKVPLLGIAPTFAVHLQHESKVRNLQRLPRNTWQAAIIALLRQVSGGHMQ